MLLSNSAVTAALALLVAGAQYGNAGRLRSAQSTQARSDPKCLSGILSAPGKPQVCCPNFCGKCSDEPTCKRSHRMLGEVNTESSCCTYKIRSLECGTGKEASASFCLKRCTMSSPPCIMDPEKRFTRTASSMRNAANDANEVVKQWRTTAQNTIKSTQKAVRLPAQMRRTSGYSALNSNTLIWLGGNGKDRVKKTAGAFHVDQKSFRSTRKVINRPLIKKLLRCSDDTQASCEECTSGSCWRDCNLKKPEGKWWGLCLSASNTGKWKRYLILVHATCEAETLEFRTNVPTLKEGQVRFLWDGRDIHQRNHYRTQGMNNLGSPIRAGDLMRQPRDYNWGGIRGWRFAAQLVGPHSPGGKGGHDLTVEFKPTGRNGKITLSDFGMFMSDQYAVCMDNKVCLKELSGVQGGLDLRNNNALQWECLEHGPVSKKLNSMQQDACKIWLQCLTRDGSSKSSQILNLLKAAGFKGDSGALLQTDGATAATGHIYPPTEDPLAWDCDCWEEMLQRCKSLRKISSVGDFSEPDCLTAQFCVHERVDSGWKQDSCGSGDIPRLIAAFPALLQEESSTQRPSTAEIGRDARHPEPHRASMRLLERSASATVVTAQEMEGSMGAKKCK
eukprot:gnl/TRDRNA2_/TRDRNA2_181133_c0_seq1.p1 gnl/TRDRNA2_/TRDRNA2_181133_c0~~gnl/TRDRNA2_/TRDRNA2_181133_c0_seq1.p1  ORF type:complete len:617 (+),score=61.28 gnl/TRDRNA2_/TRDRNA2_181133_c0_seq1:119-1969(+)